MKLSTGMLLCFLPGICVAQQDPIIRDTTLLQPVEIFSVRASDKMPVTKTTLSESDIAKNNIGQDLPFILDQTPSVVVNSDAGNGIGYTGIRIRGSDASRVNVTLNGIPYNDAESQGTFFVDLPDIASSAQSIQVQRGVGTSSNGAGSFGGAINISTNEVNTKRKVDFSSAIGSYNSFKNTLQYNTGLIAKHFTADARLSDIRSDGYIERASTRLRSFFASLAYTNNNNSIRINIFSGKEKTYQAWNGVDEKMLLINRRYNSAGTEKAGEPYSNETDNYVQTHYQLFYNHKFNKYLKANVAAFLTRGKGYYEQFKSAQLLAGYGLPSYIHNSTVVDTVDLVRRLWLDNYLYGSIFSLQYQKQHTGIIIGGSWNNYDGKHYGNIIWANIQDAVPANYRWYDLTAYKKDLSMYAKWSQQICRNWQIFVDLQLRNVNYEINGFKDNPGLILKNNYLFFNPKAGITYTNEKIQAYISYGRASKEPNREDFESGVNAAPKAEVMNDIELGVEHKYANSSFGVNAYYMSYQDQLVLTGKINDVGAYTRINIPKSYRLGVELRGRKVFNKWISVNGNFTVSTNKIKNYTEYIDDFDNGGQQTKFYKRTSIAFSPTAIGFASINVFPLKNMEVDLTGKYVGRQYLDNTTQRSRSLDPYFVADTRISYIIRTSKFTIELFGKVNNLLSKKYEPNGYTFSYIYGGELNTENYYFPMATINVMAGLNIKL
ncbi:MAG: TonB-dependent receptor plug domain-containing protein [Ferruginibacter sp.]